MEYIYYGPYKNGEYHGEGMLYNSHTKQMYTGNFKDGQLNGYGKLFTVGYTFKGNFKNGSWTGKGVLFQRRFGRNLLSLKPLIMKKYEKGIYVGKFKNGRFINGLCLVQNVNEEDSFSIIPYQRGKKNGTVINVSSSRIESQVYEDDEKRGRYTFDDGCIQIKSAFYENKICGVYEIFSKLHYHQLFFQRGKLRRRSLLSFRYKYQFVLEMQGFNIHNDVLYAFCGGKKIKNPLQVLSKTETIPHDFLCPIGREIMLQPCWTEASQCYDFKNINHWFDLSIDNIRDPMTNLPLFSDHLEFDTIKRYEILDYLAERLFIPNCDIIIYDAHGFCF